MAFALATSAGAGTISVAAGSNRGVGVGTNFVAANVRAIVVVGSQWGVIKTVNNTLNVVFDRPFETAVSGAAYQISANIPVISQTAPDTDATIVASLTGVPGVTRSVNTWTIHSASLATTNCVINRLTNVFRFVDTASVLAASTTIPAFRCNGFNNSVTQSLNGYSFKSPASSIIFDVAIPNSSSTTAVLLYSDLATTSVIEGPVEYTNTAGSAILMFGTLGSLILQNGKFINRSTVGVNYNVFAQGVSSNITLRNWETYGTGLRVGDGTTTIDNYAAIAGPYSININTGNTVRSEYVGLQDLGNTVSFRFIAGLKFLKFKNFLSTLLVPTISAANAAGGSQYLLLHQLRLSAKSISGPIEGVKFWMKDSDNGNRSPVNFDAGTDNEIATTGDLVDIAITAANGIAPTINIIGAVYWQPTGTTYVIDYRGNDGAHDRIVYAYKYGYVLANSETDLWSLKNGVYGSIAVRDQEFGLLQDLGVTEADETVVAAYLSLDDNAELYDYAFYNLVQNAAGQTLPYMTRQGDAGSYNVILNAAAANPFTRTASSLVIKSANFEGDLKTSGSVIFAPNSKASNGTVDAPNIIQDTPTDLTGVTGTGNLNYSINTPITVTFTDCDIYSVTNNGSAIVNIVLVNSTIGTQGNNVIAQQFATLSVQVSQPGSDVVITTTDAADGSGSNVLATFNAIAGTTADYTYVVDEYLVPVNIHVYKPGYKDAHVFDFALSETNSTLPISQKLDAAYA